MKHRTLWVVITFHIYSGIGEVIAKVIVPLYGLSNLFILSVFVRTLAVIISVWAS